MFSTRRRWGVGLVRSAPKKPGRTPAERDEHAGSQERALGCGRDMPGRQAHIQDCVDQILAKVDPRPAAS